jgi:cytochrome c-type biogenesis protein CcmH
VLALSALLLLATTALAVSAMPGSPQQAQVNLPDIEDEVMCPVCGTALNLSFSPQADRERAFIRQEIAQGKTKDEILNDLVAQYGTEVLAEPPKSGFDLTAWLVPGIAIILAAIAIAFGLRRWRRASRNPEEEAATSGDKPLDSAERERLDSDLARYDL